MMIAERSERVRGIAVSVVRLTTASWNVDVQHALNTVNWASAVPCCEVDRVLARPFKCTLISQWAFFLSFLER